MGCHDPGSWGAEQQLAVNNQYAVWRVAERLTLLALLVLGLVPGVLVPQVRLEPPGPPVPAISRAISE
jgi:hypothetical protein